MLKEKAPRAKIEKRITHLTDMVRSNEMRIDTIFTGLEMSIQKSSVTKAELSDVEAIDKSKADISKLKSLEERFDRLERLIEDRLDREDTVEEEVYD